MKKMATRDERHDSVTSSDDVSASEEEQSEKSVEIRQRSKNGKKVKDYHYNKAEDQDEEEYYRKDQEEDELAPFPKFVLKGQTGDIKTSYHLTDHPVWNPPFPICAINNKLLCETFRDQFEQKDLENWQTKFLFLLKAFLVNDINRQKRLPGLSRKTISYDRHHTVYVQFLYDWFEKSRITVEQVKEYEEMKEREDVKLDWIPNPAQDCLFNMLNLDSLNRQDEIYLINVMSNPNSIAYQIQNMIL